MKASERRIHPAGWLFGALIVISLLAVYGGVGSYRFLAWDDTTHVTRNPFLAQPAHFWTSLYQGFYSPITFSLYSLIYGLVGFNAPTFHLANLALHILNSLLVFALLQCLLQSLAGGRETADGSAYASPARKPAAAALHPTVAAGLGALLFALHPVQVETVSWVSSLKDVCEGFFSILALLLYCRYAGMGSDDSLGGAFRAGGSGSREQACVRPEAGRGREQRGHRRDSDSSRRGGQGKGSAASWASPGQRAWYLLALAAFVLATLSKPSAAVVVPMLAVLDRLLFRRPWRRVLPTLLPWAVAAIPSIVLNAMAQERLAMRYVTPLPYRPLIALDTLSFYLGKLFLRLELLPAYGRSPQRVIASGALWWAWIPAVALVAWLCWQRRRHPHLLAGFLIFVCGFAMVSGIVYFAAQEKTTVYDRYLYLAMIGPALAGAAALLRPRPTRALPAAALILLLLGLKSGAQTRIWKDDESLWTCNVARRPDSAVALINLGIVRSDQGRLEEARDLYQRAVEVVPDDPQARNNLGSALARLGRLEEAAGEFEASLRLDPRQKPAHRNFAEYFLKKGEPERALGHFQAILEIDPRDAEASLGLGEAYWRLGRHDDCLRLMQGVIAWLPESAEAHTLLGVARAAKGELPPAVRSFQKALALDPSYEMARVNLQTALAELSKRGPGALR